MNSGAHQMHGLSRPFQFRLPRAGRPAHLVSHRSTMPAEYLIISASLRPGSLSRLLGQFLAEELAGEHLDLREYPLPMCDGDAAYADPSVEKLRARIAGARAIFLAVPIY